MTGATTRSPRDEGNPSFAPRSVGNVISIREPVSLVDGAHTLRNPNPFGSRAIRPIPSVWPEERSPRGKT